MSMLRSPSTARISASTKICTRLLPLPCSHEATFVSCGAAPNPAGGGGQSMPDGTKPEPGGWNRFSIEVGDLATTVEALRKAGAHFRNDIVTGIGGKQILVDDPSGNAIELFEPTLPEARLSSSS